MLLWLLNVIGVADVDVKERFDQSLVKISKKNYVFNGDYSSDS